LASLEERWRLIFNLAWDGRGLTVDLTNVPDQIMAKFVEWRAEKIEEENATLPK